MVYRLYGLRVRSAVPLPAPICGNASSPSDVEVLWNSSEWDPAPTGRAAERVLAELRWGDRYGYTLTSSETGYRLCFHGSCEFAFDPALHSISVHLSDGVSGDMATVLLAGNVLACLLTLSGELVLHASAVEIDGGALAFVGGSGMGKSTLAALLCAEGARLVCDDVLRLASDGDGLRCFPGTGEIRLRKHASTLVERFPATVRRPTPDGRVALQLVSSRTMPLLRAIVIPRLSRSARELKVERLSQSKALLFLMVYPRIQGWRKDYVECQFRAFARIASNVPVFEAEIPWAPPFHDEIGISLAQGVGLGSAEVRQ